ncbi:uncharacterized protein LOC120339890 [Styela clava]
MAMFVTVLVIASVFTGSQAGLIPSCTLPQVSDEVDMGKVQGDWYLSARENQEVYDVISCEVSTNTKTEQGFTAHVKFYNGEDASDVREDTPEFTRVAPSTFHIVQNKGDSSEITEIENDDTNAGADAQIVLEDDSIRQNPFLYISDYATYNLILHCNLDGDKEIYVETKTPSASGDVILKVRNQLIDFENGWENVKVHPSKCDQVIGK